MRRLPLALVVIVLSAPFVSGQSVVRPLIVAAPTEKRDEAVLGKEVTPKCPVPWSVRLVTLHGGKQKGSQLLLVDSGKVQIVLIPTRGLGILQVTMGELRLGWDSPIKDVVNPAYMNLLARGGLGWLEGFNEWLCRCGLENVGQPGKDEIVTNTGDRAEVELTLHGKIANIPANDVSVEAETVPPYRVIVRGKVVEAMLFGPRLRLTTELVVVPGATSFLIRDYVENLAAGPQEFQLLYHLNFGKPLLDDGARLRAAVTKVTPFNARAATDVKTWDRFTGPQPGYVEQVYLLRPLADESNQAEVLLHDRAAARGVALRYGLNALPYLTLWKNTGAMEDGYVIGIEPGTSYPNRRKIERRHGRVPKLEGGGRHAVAINVELLEGEAAVRAVADRIERRQNSQPVRVEPSPEPQE